jgi:hypothetical protein
VTIAAFDPALSRYVTKATKGVPITVVAVASFDPRTLRYTAPSSDSNRWVSNILLEAAALVVFALAATALAILIHRRRHVLDRSWPAAARRLARRIHRELGNVPTQVLMHHLCDDPAQSAWAHFMRTSPHIYQPAAQRITDALIEYARVGVGRPPGALTPDEAREVVSGLTRSSALGDRAAELLARCDLALFADRPQLCDTKELLEIARGLFDALGQAPITSEGEFHQAMISESPGHATE